MLAMFMKCDLPWPLVYDLCNVQIVVGPKKWDTFNDLNLTPPSYGIPKKDLFM